MMRWDVKKVIPGEPRRGDLGGDWAWQAPPSLEAVPGSNKLGASDKQALVEWHMNCQGGSPSKNIYSGVFLGSFTEVSVENPL